MAWFTDTADLKDQIFNLERRVEIRDNEIKMLHAQIQEMNQAKVDEIKADVNASEFAIDWANMDAFSVERMGDKKVAYTVIGYYQTVGTDRVVAEWKFYCSLEQHQKLAAEFIKHKNKSK